MLVWSAISIILTTGLKNESTGEFKVLARKEDTAYLTKFLEPMVELGIMKDIPLVEY